MQTAGRDEEFEICCNTLVASCAVGDDGGSGDLEGHPLEAPAGSPAGTSSWEFTGTIEGLGTGMMTYDRIFESTSEGLTSWYDVITGGTGDFEGITGTGQASYGSYIYVLNAPVNQ